MDYSSLALFMKLDLPIEKLYDEKTLDRSNLMLDPLVCSFLKNETWRTQDWNSFLGKHIAFRKRMFNILGDTIKEEAPHIAKAIIEEIKKEI